MQILRTLVAGTLVVASVVAGDSSQQQQQQHGGQYVPKVTLKNGPYLGRYLPEFKQDLFLGMPFAKPPVNELRLNNPQPLNETWKEPRNATHFSLGCRDTEDCLTLDVIRPRNRPSNNLPVAVWIHGGAYLYGYSGDPTTNMSYMVQQSDLMKKPIIAVAINYRLAGFGFLWGKEVQAAGVGNLGLKDQRLALHWVQENIAQFGGDPKKVTIFGESAGGGSVGNQLLAYGGRDDHLFRAALIESMDIAMSEEEYYSAELFQPSYKKLTDAVGCTDAKDSLVCLRQVPYAKLSSALDGASPRYFPNIDGDFIQESGAAQLTKGKFLHVPLMHGQNSDEGTFFGPKGLNTNADFENFIKTPNDGFFTPKRTDEETKILLALYPDILAIGQPSFLKTRPAVNSTIGAMWKRAVAYAGDAHMHAGRRFMAQVWSKVNLPSYAYNYNVLANGYEDWKGASHAAELGFVFHVLDGAGYDANPFANKPASYLNLSTLMCRMWISFFYDQTPNHNGLTDVEWPLYNNDDAKILIFDPEATPKLVYVAPDTYRAEAIAYIMSLKH